MSQRCVCWLIIDPARHREVEAYDAYDAAIKFCQLGYAGHGGEGTKNSFVRNIAVNNTIAVVDSDGKHYDVRVEFETVPTFNVIEAKEKS